MLRGWNGTGRATRRDKSAVRHLNSVTVPNTDVLAVGHSNNPHGKPRSRRSASAPPPPRIRQNPPNLPTRLLPRSHLHDGQPALTTSYKPPAIHPLTPIPKPLPTCPSAEPPLTDGHRSRTYMPTGNRRTGYVAKESPASLIQAKHLTTPRTIYPKRVKVVAGSDFPR